MSAQLPAAAAAAPLPPGWPFEFVVGMTDALQERAGAKLRALGYGKSMLATMWSVARTYVGWCRAVRHDPLDLAGGRESFLQGLAEGGEDRPKAAASTLRSYRCALRAWTRVLDAEGGQEEGRARGTAAGALVTSELPADIEEKLREYLELAHRAMAPATMRALHADIGLWRRWCLACGVSWLPATPADLRAYIKEVGENRSPATVARYLASISTLHQAVGAPNPTADRLVALERRAHARKRGVRQTQARPLGGVDLQTVLEELQEPGKKRLTPKGRAPAAPIALPPRAVDLRDRALLLVGRDLLARAGELGELRWVDLEPGRLDDPAVGPGEGTIVIRRSKTDQLGMGKTAWLSPEAMDALALWRDRLSKLAVRLERSADAAAEAAGTWLFPALARRTLRAGALRPLSAAGVRGVVQQRTERLHLERAGKRWSGHSLRVGAAQDLLAAGADLLGLMEAGRWGTPRMPAHYTERIAAGRGVVARAWRAAHSGKAVGNVTQQGKQQRNVQSL